MSKNKDGGKMKKINAKKITILLIFLSIILLVSKVQAFDPNDQNWVPSSTTEVTGATKFEGFANTIIGGVQVIGSITSVIALIVMGIRYMLGSVEEKAEYKKTMKPYLIGAIMVFGITNLLTIIQTIVGSF